MSDQNNLPAWLNAPSEGPFPSPPIDTRPQTLPFGELTWENFERLIRRLVDREATISECWVYGTPGQAQFGLDILAARNKEPIEFACYQCKCVREFSGEDIKKAIDKFLGGKWADKTKSFVLCTSSALSKTEQVDEIAAQCSRLADRNIDFQVWDGSEGGQLTERLKRYPDLVDDFFLREWVRRFNGEEAAKSLGEKLDGIELEKLRSQLHEVYTTLFLRHDQGLRLGSQRPASLLKRYIAPAVIESRNITTSEPLTDSPPSRQGEQNSSSTGMQNSQRPRIQANMIREIRIPVGEWFSRHGRSVVLGEPGYGKSTLLRVIALQLLSKRDDPFQTPWSKLLPVWISFGGFSSAIQAQPNLSLEDYFDNWLHQNAADDRRSAFAGMLLLGKYNESISVLTKDSPSALHWLAEYHETDSLTSRTLFEHWDALHNASQTLGKTFEIPWGGLVYNGTASEALVNSSARSQLISFLKTMPPQDRSPESLILIAELLPGSNELRTCLIEMINDRRSLFRESNIAEAQRIYAEQFGGNQKALSDLWDTWAAPGTDIAQSITPLLYAMALGWPDNPVVQALLKQDVQPRLPLYIALSLCSITGDEIKALACIERMIDATWENGRALPVQYQNGLRKWAFSPSAEALLQKLICDPDCSRMITALRLLATSGKLVNESRLEIIRLFNAHLEGVDPVPDGVDVFLGKATSITQVIAEEFLDAST